MLCYSSSGVGWQVTFAWLAVNFFAGRHPLLCNAVYVPEEGVDPLVKFGVNTGLVTLAPAAGIQVSFVARERQVWAYTCCCT